MISRPSFSILPFWRGLPMPENPYINVLVTAALTVVFIIVS